MNGELLFALRGGFSIQSEVYVLSRDHTSPLLGNYFPATPCCTEQDGRMAEIMEYPFFSPRLSP